MSDSKTYVFSPEGGGMNSFDPNLFAALNNGGMGVPIMWEDMM